MKKITTIFILLFIGAAIFAEPIEVPKYVVPFEEVIPYMYISNDCQNIYEIYAKESKSKDHYELNFYNISLILPTSIYLEIEFTSKKKYDDFVKDIDLSDLEKSFAYIRQKIIKQGVTPDIAKYNNGKPYGLSKEDKTKYGYGYDESFDFQNLPDSVIYRIKY